MGLGCSFGFHFAFVIAVGGSVVILVVHLCLYDLIPFIVIHGL